MLEKTTVNIFIGTSLLLAALFLAISLQQRRRRLRMQNQREGEQVENLRQQELLNAIIRTQEQERNRIATDLHDSVGSELSMLKLNLSKFAYFLSKKEIENKALLEELVHLDQTIDHLGDICKDLYPVTLKTYGFIKTFEEMISKVNKRTGIDCRYRFNLKESDLFSSLESKLNLLRLFQEILNNLLKYSECTVLDIGFMKYPNAIKIILKHNGLPFGDADAVEMRRLGKGVGLDSIYKRLFLLNGLISYTSVPNGSEVLIELPLPNEEKN